MSTTEQRFEVPPEYADVYERAYRRAYEEGQSQLSGPPAAVAPRRLNGRGKRIAVPQQRAGSRRERTDVPPGGSHLSVHGPRDRDRAVRRERADDEQVVEPAAHAVRSGHRADRRRGSTVLPLLGLLILLGALLACAFVLGRVTAGTVRVDRTSGTGAGPGAAASASEGPRDDTSSGATPYAGPQGPLAILSARSTCATPPVLPGAAAGTSYDAANVLDDDPTTAWGCAGQGVGDELSLSLPSGARVVSVGLVPGFATTDASTGVDRYAQDDRVTQVAWIFGDGTQVVQSISDDPLDRSLRTVALAPTAGDTVTVRVLAVTRGEVDATLVSTVVIEGATG